MQDLGSLIIVHLVEKRPVGDVFRRKRADWPLHVTLVPWFDIREGQRAQLLATLSDYGRATAPFLVQIGEQELFGSEHDVPVNLIVEQKPVLRLHNDLMAIAQQFGAQFHQNASAHSGVKESYRAHITHHDAGGVVHRRFPGDQENFNDFTIARLLDNNGMQMCEIIQHVTLSGEAIMLASADGSAGSK